MTTEYITVDCMPLRCPRCESMDICDLRTENYPQGLCEAITCGQCALSWVNYYRYENTVITITMMEPNS
jgi:hypothetical protein